MSRLDNLDEMSTQQVGTGSFGFTATNLDVLGATEYTLVGLAVDASSSVYEFESDLNSAIGAIVESCVHSPRCDNLMLRLSQFSSNLQEIHGFKMLSSCNPGDYNGILDVRGATALNDAVVDMCDSMSNYGSSLTKQDFDVNGILFVVTDGDENNSSHGLESAKKAIQDIRRNESLESLITILLGVNIDSTYVKQKLDDYHQQIGFDQFISVGDASPKTLAKLAEFVSKSISSQSQALGTGGPSQAIPTSLGI